MKKLIIGTLVLIGIAAVALVVDKYGADMEAIRHEFEQTWESLNSLEGIDPAEAGEPK